MRQLLNTGLRKYKRTVLVRISSKSSRLHGCVKYAWRPVGNVTHRLSSVYSTPRSLSRLVGQLARLGIARLELLQKPQFKLFGYEVPLVRCAFSFGAPWRKRHIPCTVSLALLPLVHCMQVHLLTALSRKWCLRCPRAVMPTLG
jgi:hypothetical protein